VGPAAAVEHGQDLGAGGRRRRRARRPVVRHAARRVVPLRRWRHELGDRALAVGPPLAPEVERRRRRPARHSFDLRRSPRFALRSPRGVYRRGVDHARRRRDLGMPRHRHAGGVHAARTPVRHDLTGRAPAGPVPQRPRLAVGAAPQRRVPLHRRRRDLDRDRGHAAVEFRLCRRRAPGGSGHRLVRSRRQGRAPHSGFWRTGRQPHPRRRQEFRGSAQRPAAAGRL
jgi:hypothetical protein